MKVAISVLCVCLPVLGAAALASMACRERFSSQQCSVVANCCCCHRIITSVECQSTALRCSIEFMLVCYRTLDSKWEDRNQTNDSGSMALLRSRGKCTGLVSRTRRVGGARRAKRRLNSRCGRVRATGRASQSAPSLQGASRLAEIVERGACVLAWMRTDSFLLFLRAHRASVSLCRSPAENAPECCANGRRFTTSTRGSQTVTAGAGTDWVTIFNVFCVRLSTPSLEPARGYVDYDPSTVTYSREPCIASGMLDAARLRYSMQVNPGRYAAAELLLDIRTGRTFFRC